MFVNASPICLMKHRQRVSRKEVRKGKGAEKGIKPKVTPFSGDISYTGNERLKGLKAANIDDIYRIRYVEFQENSFLPSSSSLFS